MTQKHKDRKKKEQKQNGPHSYMQVGRQTKFITKLFKKANLKISSKIESTIEKLLNQNNKNFDFNKFNKRGIY